MAPDVEDHRIRGERAEFAVLSRVGIPVFVHQGGRGVLLSELTNGSAAWRAARTPGRANTDLCRAGVFRIEAG